MTFNLKYNHGDPVLVVDQLGTIEARGTIVGRHESRTGAIYDVQPAREYSMAKRVTGIPEERIVRMGRPYLAYQAPVQPVHIRDEA